MQGGEVEGERERKSKRGRERECEQLLPNKATA